MHDRFIPFRTFISLFLRLTTAFLLSSHRRPAAAAAARAAAAAHAHLRRAILQARRHRVLLRVRHLRAVRVVVIRVALHHPALLRVPVAALRPQAAHPHLRP
jgi:hypothetical protein